MRAFGPIDFVTVSETKEDARDEASRKVGRETDATRKIRGW